MNFLVWGVKEKPRFILWSLAFQGTFFCLGLDEILTGTFGFSIEFQFLMTLAIALFSLGYLRYLYNKNKKTPAVLDQVLDEDDITNNVLWGRIYSPKLTIFCVSWILILGGGMFFISSVDMGYPFFSSIAMSLLYISLFGFPVLWVLGYKRKRNRKKKIQLLIEVNESHRELDEFLDSLVYLDRKLDISEIADHFSLSEEEMYETIQQKITDGVLRLRLTLDNKSVISDHAITVILKNKLEE